MKKILLAVFILMSFISYSQQTGYFRYDTVRIQRGGGNATLVIENATRNVTGGFLQNYGEGRTKFARALDSVWVDGDSLRFRYGLTTIAVSAPGGGPSFGFFNDETNDGGSTTKDANGQSYTLTGVDTLTLGFNELYLPDVPEGEVEEIGLKFLLKTEEGRVVTASVGDLKFGDGDNELYGGRDVNINGYEFKFVDATPDPAVGIPEYYFQPGAVGFTFTGTEFESQFRMTPNVFYYLFTKESALSGFTFDANNPDHVNTTWYSTGNLTFEIDSIRYNALGTVSDTSLYKPFVIDGNGYVHKFDRWPGGGVSDNLYTANGTLTSNRTLTGDNKSLRFNGVSVFGVRGNGVSLDQLYVDGSTAGLYSPTGDGVIAISDGLVEIVSGQIKFPTMAGSGDRHLGVDADGVLKIVTGGSGAFDGILELGDSPFGLIKPNDSTYAVDSAALRPWIEALVTPNLISTSIGTEGIGVLDPRNDSLLYRRITTESDLVTVDTLATGEISIGIDSTALAGFVEDHSVGGTGVTLTDDPLALEEEFAMGIDTIRHRSFIKERNVVRWGPITDSAFTLSQLSTPGSFAASPASDVQINLTWTDVLNEMGYQIYRNTVNDFGTATLINSPAADATSYNSTGLTASTLYYYWILAEGDGVVFSNSNTATTSATTNAGLDADASNYLSRVAAHGVTVSTPQQNAVNQLFLDLKAASIYTLYYDMYFFGWGNAAANGEPLKGVAPDMTWNGTVTHNSSGVTGNGTTGFGNTGIIPSSVLTLNNTHLSIKTSTSSSAAIVDIGARGASSTVRLDLLASSGSNLIGQFNSNTAGAGQISASAPNSLGSSMVSRVSSTDLRAYRNGIQIGSTATTTNNGTMPGVAIYVCATNNNGTAASFSARTYQGCTIGFGMSPTEVLAHYEAFDDFYTAMGF